MTTRFGPLFALWLAGGAALAAPASPAEAGPSIRSMEGVWETDTMAKVSLDALPGRVRVFAMFYSGCHMACPVTVEALQWIEKNLSPAAAAETQFVLVTLDPGGDTPEDLRAFRSEARLSARWTLLRGTRRMTRELADTLGISFTHEAVRLTHTAAIVVIGADGEIRSRHTTLRPDLRAVVKSVETLTASPAYASRPQDRSRSP